MFKIVKDVAMIECLVLCNFLDILLPIEAVYLYQINGPINLHFYV